MPTSSGAMLTLRQGMDQTVGGWGKSIVDARSQRYIAQQLHFVMRRLSHSNSQESGYDAPSQRSDFLHRYIEC